MHCKELCSYGMVRCRMLSIMTQRLGVGWRTCPGRFKGVATSADGPHVAGCEWIGDQQPRSVDAIRSLELICFGRAQQARTRLWKGITVSDTADGTGMMRDGMLMYSSTQCRICGAFLRIAWLWHGYVDCCSTMVKRVTVPSSIGVVLIRSAV